MTNWLSAHYEVIRDFTAPTVALVGVLITAGIAGLGLQSFNRWKREKLEERRIGVAFDALAVTYKTKFVFEHIRSAMASSPEWRDMPQLPGDDDDKRSRRGSFYAVFKRIEQNKEFFNAVWDIQPKFMAAFGAKTESTFLKLHSARRHVEVAAQMLYEHTLNGEQERTDDVRELYQQLRADIWGAYGRLAKEGDRVGKQLEEFRSEMEAICLLVIAEYRKPNR